MAEGLGTYSNAGLGFGVAFYLDDQFSKAADQVMSKMKTLQAAAIKMSSSINSSMATATGYTHTYSRAADAATAAATKTSKAAVLSADFFERAKNASVPLERSLVRMGEQALTNTQNWRLWTEKGLVPFEDKLKNITATPMGGLNEELDEVAIKAQSVYQGLMLIYGGAMLLRSLWAPLESASDFQRNRIAMAALTGNEKVTDNLIEKLKAYTYNAPYTFKEVNAGATRMLAAGENPKNLMRDLGLVGDIAAIDPSKFENLILIMDKVQNKGVVMGQELRQLGAMQVPIFEALSKIMGVSKVELSKEGSQRKISYEDLIKAFTVLAGPGGPFNGMALKQMATAVGAATTHFKDTVYTLGVAIGNTLTRPVVALLKVMGSLLTSLREFAESWVGKAVTSIVSLGIALAGLSLIWVGFEVVLRSKLITEEVIPLLIIHLAKLKSALLSFVKFEALGEVGFGNIVKFPKWVGPILVLAAAVAILNKAWTEFGKVMDGGKIMGGVHGDLQKMGGLMHYAAMAWRTGTGGEKGTWTTTQFMENTMGQMGLTQTAHHIAQYVGRLKELARGIWDFFKDAGKAVIWTVKIMVYPIDLAVRAINSIAAGFGLATSAMGTWKAIGYVIGGIMLAIIVALTAATWQWAFATLAATWEYVVWAAAILAVVYALHELNKALDSLGLLHNPVAGLSGEQAKKYTDTHGGLLGHEDYPKKYSSTKKQANTAEAQQPIVIQNHVYSTTMLDGEVFYKSYNKQDQLHNARTHGRN